MVNILSESILKHLASVQAARQRQKLDPKLNANVLAVKAYQAQRFTRTYADWLSSPKYQATAAFFLGELYGANDFTRRDEQFARIVPTLGKVFPNSVVHTVDALAELHALSESLDEAMAGAIEEQPITPCCYTRAWQRVARPIDRKQQIRLTCAIATSLAKHTSSKLLRTALKMMRGPANAAGMSDLQKFLEAGLDAFSQIGDVSAFTGTLEKRENALAKCLDRPPPWHSSERLSDQYNYFRHPPLDQLP